jgi:hypothetical protein
MEWVHDLEFGLFVGQWEIVDGAGKLNGKGITSSPSST